MGGPESEAKYEAFIETFAQYLIRNVRPSISISSMEQDIQEYLDEILDEEFNTVLDDGSSQELAQLFIRYIQLIQQGKLADVQQELQAYQTTTAIQMSVRNENEDDSSSSSEDDDENDNEMKEEPSANESKSQAMDVDEEGWTTVHRRGDKRK
jgi:pre-rRNA-processing protein TSR2